MNNAPLQRSIRVVVDEGTVGARNEENRHDSIRDWAAVGFGEEAPEFIVSGIVGNIPDPHHPF